ncbi:MAG: hypothetical protein JWM88_2511 [Verrucomicrobia bacterium]|nr:hypothetical protein [Verrucomicrobiota bacterium]
MKLNTKLGWMISTAAISLGLALSAGAQTSDVAVSSATIDPASLGLLGSSYSAFNLRYTDIDGGSPTAMRGVGLQLNQAWRPGIDFQVNYDWGRATAGPIRVTYQDLNTGVTVFSKLDWGKPFVQALAGWEWRRGLPALGNSFAYNLGTGVELQLSPRFALTPSMSFVRATGVNRSEVDYALKGTYRVNRQWSVSAAAQYDSVYHKADAKVYTLGVNYHY